MLLFVIIYHSFGRNTTRKAKKVPIYLGSGNIVFGDPESRKNDLLSREGKNVEQSVINLSFESRPDLFRRNGGNKVI